MQMKSAGWDLNPRVLVYRAADFPVGRNAFASMASIHQASRKHRRPVVGSDNRRLHLAADLSVTAVALPKQRLERPSTSSVIGRKNYTSVSLPELQERVAELERKIETKADEEALL